MVPQFYPHGNFNSSNFPFETSLASCRKHQITYILINLCKSRCDVLSVIGWYVWYLSEVPVIPANSGCTQTPCGTTDITGDLLFWRIRKILVSVFMLYFWHAFAVMWHMWRYVRVDMCGVRWVYFFSLARQARGQCRTLRHSASNSVKLKICTQRHCVCGFLERFWYT